MVFGWGGDCDFVSVVSSWGIAVLSTVSSPFRVISSMYRASRRKGRDMDIDTMSWSSA